MVNKKDVNRINVIFLFFLILGGLLTSRLFFLQIISQDYYRTLASRQHSYSKILNPKRGNIYFQNKFNELITVADTKNGFDVFINPKILNNKESNFLSFEEIYDQIATVIDVDHDYFFSRLKRTDDPYEVIAQQVELEEAFLVRDLNIEGVDITPVEWRYYPAGNIASHIVGFSGYNKDKIEGRYGLEKYFEDVLRGESGYVEAKKSNREFFLDLGRKIFKSPQEGQDLVLTINIDVQLFLENSLKTVQDKWGSVSAGGIVMEPKTGRILAMASLPDFDPNEYGQVENINVFVNPLLSKTYELGSIFKPLTMAAALDVGAVEPNTKYFDKGYLILNSRRIENYDGEGRGEVDMQVVLEKSLNTGAVFAMQEMGKEDFYEYMINYGLDSKTDIELPNEALGNLVNLDTHRDIEYATASYGQGIAVTGLAATRAFAALANGGLLMKPYIIDRIIKPGQPDYVTQPKIQSRVISAETSETINRMLVKVVDDALLGGTVKDPHYTIAAKTGTALIASSDGTGYSDQFLHSFFGYGPGFDAEFLVFLYIEKPQGVRYASESLTEPFMDIIHFLFNYYEVPPDR